MLTCVFSIGIPASQCLEKINVTTRSMKGKEGGVIRLAYLTAVVPNMGENLVTTIAGGAPPMEPDEVWLTHSLLLSINAGHLIMADLVTAFELLC
jgi:hypothetical protein